MPEPHHFDGSEVFGSKIDVQYLGRILKLFWRTLPEATFLEYKELVFRKT
jgi:hypothetical protein